MKISNHKSKKLVKFQTKNLQSPKNKQKIYSQEISCLLWRFCNLYSSKAQTNFLWSKFKHYTTILMFKEYKRFRYFIKYSYAQEMELSSSKIKKLVIFQEGTYWTWKSNKKSVPKKFLVSCDVFVIFTAVKHWEIPCYYVIWNKRIRELLKSNICIYIYIYIYIIY